MCLLCWDRDSPALQAGTELAATDLLKSKQRNIYYWYYANQLLHNVQGPAREKWNAKVRDGQVGIQVKGQGCDRGSWDPLKPVADRWDKEAGRYFVTCLSLLTLEVYYRYLPLYQDRGEATFGARGEAALNVQGGASAHRGSAALGPRCQGANWSNDTRL